MEMPELKPGMVIEYNEPSKRFFIMKTMKGELFGISNDDLWFSGIDNKNINKIWNINKPFKILSDSNLHYCAELIWERKPEVDWTKVAVDTPILVRNSFDDKWTKAHFWHYNEDSKIIKTIKNGKSSFTSCGGGVDEWTYGVLYKGNERLVGEISNRNIL